MTDSRPIDLATEHTVQFVSDALPAKCSLLEIGCGNGDVAAKLMALGFTVHAIDSDPAAVAAARKKNVNADVSEWPAYDAPEVDAVIFTRSLHHIHDLPGAIAAAARLYDNGMLLVEDFAFDAADQKTVEWFLGIAESNSIAPHLKPASGSFLEKILGAKDPAAAWRHDHDHDLHSFEMMTHAVSARFGKIETSVTPYLFRYFIDALPDTDSGIHALNSIFDHELKAIENNVILPIGRRLTATK